MLSEPFLQRLRHMRFKKMPSHRSAVPLSGPTGRALGLALVQCDIADQGDHFHLLINLVFQVVLRLPIDITGCRRR